MGKEYSYFEEKCKCGKGKILIAIETNDFDGSHSSEQIDL